MTLEEGNFSISSSPCYLNSLSCILEHTPHTYFIRQSLIYFVLFIHIPLTQATNPLFSINTTRLNTSLYFKGEKELEGKGFGNQTPTKNH